MTRSIESQLNESYRDALVEYYLSEVVPNSPALISLGLSNRLKTANDLYEFFLLDNQVSQEVQTSPVASAISSLQQYINGALMGMEPGYDLLRPDEARFVEWRDRSSQYPIWAANMKLALYPEVYISPALRLKKSSYFAQLENDINQNKINIDTTQEAVKSYLASFEEVANLTIINGYIDSDRFAEGKYYFVGKSRAENIYYWRTVDMNERAYKAGTEGPKYDNPTPGAWSDWKRANIGVNANTLERTIRPVYFNNRLFISWVDVSDVAGESKIGGSEETPTVATVEKVKLTFNLSYKKYDDSWSAPQIYMDVTTHKNFHIDGAFASLEKKLNSVAVFDTSNSPESLFIAMYAGEQPGDNEVDGTNTRYTFLASAYIDKNFNATDSFPASHYTDTRYDADHCEPNELRTRNTCWTFSVNNKQRFQFTWSPIRKIAARNIRTTDPKPDIPDYNYDDLQAAISPIDGNNNTAIINYEQSYLQLTTKIQSQIGSTESLEYNLNFRRSPLNPDPLFDVTVHLIPSNKSASDDYQYLGKGSYLRIGELPPDAAALGFIINKPGLPPFLSTIKDIDSEGIKLPLNWDYNTSYSLEGKLALKPVLNALRESNNTLYPACNIYINFGGTGTTLYVVNLMSTASALPALEYRQIFGFPYDMNDPTASVSTTIASSATQQLFIPPSPLTARLNFNKETAGLIALYRENTELKTRYFIFHGIEVFSGVALVGRALKCTQFELHFEAFVEANKIAPKISTRPDPILGIAEYIDFSASTIQHSDGSTTVKRKPIRMNTLFARELINKANIALEALLSWNTQQLQEPPIGDDTEPDKMDFKGANGLYFWELFLHLPFMVSHRLNLEQQFSEAEQWLGFIFAPSRKAHDSAPAYWNVRPLTEVSDPDYFMRAPIDPDGIAASDPVRYQKAVYFHYIKNLIDRGDMAYRQLTPDSLGEAKLWYVRILDLLGPRPDTVLASRWTPGPLQALAASTSAPLREFASRLERQEQQVRNSALANDGQSLVSFAEPPLRLSTFASDPTLAEEDNDRFITPMNAELVKYWDMLESRLYNLRHNLTLDGKPLSLPLFAAPLDPRALLAAYANGATGGGAGSLLAQEVPHYRYAVMFSRASAAVDTLTQFGATLLSLIERQEQGQLMELQQQQAWEFAQFAIDLQQEAQKVEIEARKALEASKAIADARAGFYGDLADEVVSGVEILAGSYHLSARVAEGVASIANIVAAGLKPIPDHVGIEAGATGGMAVGAMAGAAVGGAELEGIPQMVAMGALATATANESMSYALDRAETFRRRHQEWTHARDQATLESEHITAQLAVHDAQARVTALLLSQATEARKQAEVLYAFLNKRFTNSQLYSWLNGQFSTFYYQAYDATLSLCLAAQSCWQYEIGDYTTHFIQPGAWKEPIAAWRLAKR